MDNEKITDFAFLELILTFLATIITLYIKIYGTYQISWWALLYPLLGLISFNLVIVVISIILLIISLFKQGRRIINKNEKEENDEE